jgi:hypothetical protein
MDDHCQFNRINNTRRVQLLNNVINIDKVIYIDLYH